MDRIGTTGEVGEGSMNVDRSPARGGGFSTFEGVCILSGNGLCPSIGDAGTVSCSISGEGVLERVASP